MEDQFANILQRNYGLKAVGKSASYGPRSDAGISSRALDRGKSVGSGLGRINQSAAAALLLAGDNLGTLSKSSRLADPPLTQGSAPEQGFHATSKSTSVGGFDAIYSGGRSGSVSSSSLADLLADRNVEKSAGASSDSPYNEDISAVYSQSRSRPTEHATQSNNEQEPLKENVGRRSSRGGESRRSTKEEFLDSLIVEPRMESQAGSVPSSSVSPRSQNLKSSLAAEPDPVLNGSFLRGFGWSRARAAMPLSSGNVDSQTDASVGNGSHGPTGSRVNPEYNRKTASGASSASLDGSEAMPLSSGNVESQPDASVGNGSHGPTGNGVNPEYNRNTASGASSASVDGSEAELLGRPDSTTGFTIPASNGTMFPDVNDPNSLSSADLVTKRPSQVKVSSGELDSGQGVRNSSEKLAKTPKSPKTPASCSNEAKESPSSGPGPFAAESRSRASSQGVSPEKGVPLRRAFDLNSVDSPTVSPSYVHRSRKSTRSDVVNRPNGSGSNIDESLTKFEVNMPTVGASAGSQRARRKSDGLNDVWLTVDQIRLVTKPCKHPPPSRPPPPPPVRQYAGVDKIRRKSQSSETAEGQRSERLQASDSVRQRFSPNAEVSSTDKAHPGQAAQQRVGLERTQSSAKQQVSGSERANGGVETQVEKQKMGYALPEVTVVDLGSEEMKPSREDRRRMRDQIERGLRRAKREEERRREKERLQEEGLRQSIFNDTDPSVIREGVRSREGRREKVFDPRESMSNDTDTSGGREPSRGREGRREKVFDPRDLLSNDTDTSGGREPSRGREGRREKVFDPRERHSVETVSRRDEKDIQFRALRQQEKEFQARMARQEDAREKESERSSDKVRRSAEKAALEAQERAERAAVERVVQEAHERAEKAARQRAAAAREKERAKEKEREREKERDREEEKLRDRLREKERGLAEQLRSRDSFRATSEPRQRPTVLSSSPSGLSRFSSGGNLGNFAGQAETQLWPSGQKGVVEKVSANVQSPSGIPEKFQEIPGEPADRRKLRLEKQMLIEERAAKALKEKNMRDQQVQREQEERQRFASSLDADVRRWSAGKEGNLRALLSTLHVMLWPECNWKVVSLTDLVSGPAVKKSYQRAILCVHPDKVQQKGANVKQKYIAEKVFDLLKDAYAKFNNELY